MPGVSVVLPVRNAATTVGRAVDSILGQTWSDLELIVIDDGSTDGSLDVVRSRRDDRLRIVEQRHAGVATAANRGFAVAEAPLVARMDADDFSHPERIERQVAWIEEHDLDAVGCRVRIVDERGRAVPSLSRYVRWINDETRDETSIAALRFVEFPLVNPTILARRAYFDLGFRDGPFPEDYDLFLRAIASGLRIGKVDEPLFDWTDHDRRVTRRDDRYSPEAFDRCRRMHLLDGPLAGVGVVDLWGLGRTGKPWLRWLRKRGHEVRHGYDISERRIGQKLQGVRVRAPSSLVPADGTPLLIAVGAAGARDVIAPQLESRGYVPGVDAWFVA